MCLSNEKKPRGTYKLAWKVFLKSKDGKLHTPVRDCDTEYIECVPLVAHYGFHGFINKEDAEDFVGLMKYLCKNNIHLKKPRGAKFIVKKVLIHGVRGIGFTPINAKDKEKWFSVDIYEPDNSLRFLVMVIQE